MKKGAAIAKNAFDFDQANRFLQSGRLEQFIIIREMADGKQHFIHRCFAEYFMAKLFTDNFISDTLLISKYKVARDIFDRMLAKVIKIHDAVLNNDISTVEEFLKNKTHKRFNKSSRTTLHRTASYNSPYTQKLLHSAMLTPTYQMKF